MRRILSVLFLAIVLIMHGQQSSLKIEQVMTAQELQRTGVATLSLQQRTALDRWLVTYTASIVSVAATVREQNASSTRRAITSSCVPAIEAAISGDFEGWDGETIFKLDNGQIWQQAEYEYMYSYSYSPNVTIYQTSGGCRMKLEDEEETILVKRIK